MMKKKLIIKKQLKKYMNGKIHEKKNWKKN